MTEMESARKGDITDLVRRVAEREGVGAQALHDNIAAGWAVIPANRRRVPSRPCAVGKGLRVKVNANIGSSHDFAELDHELQKLNAAVAAGADTVMDLSTGGDIQHIRRRILEESPVPIGSVPMYDAVVQCSRGSGRGLLGMSADDILAAVRRHCRDGVDFVTLHCGVTRDVVGDIDKRPRICGIVSRGGTFLAEWMRLHKQENPLFARFDEVLDILREHDVTLSLGDGLRPGAIADAFDPAQVHELEVLSELCVVAQEHGVQVIIEGPGHVPLDQVEAQVKLQKAICHGAPFYVLGPIVTDVAPGYDHITSAIGGAVAAMAGADFLCYVTPSEHLALPTVEHVHEGVIAARIAAHAADVARGDVEAKAWDRNMSVLRRQRQWDGQMELAIDPERARTLRRQRLGHDSKVCSMCGDLCVFRIADHEG